MGLVIVVGLINQTAGAILLAVEVGVAIGFFYQRSRGSVPRTADVASADDGVHRVLVVANETVGGQALLSELHGRAAPHRRSEILVVTPPLAGSAAEHWSSDVDAGIAEARRRLDSSVESMRAAGLNVRGRLGDHHDPNQAIEDALGEFAADEIVISTHVPKRSRWLESGVVEKARSELPQPVTHVVVDLEAEQAEPAPRG